MTMKVVEKRNFPRMDPDIFAQIRTHDGWHEPAECIDVSAGGALVAASRHVEVGERVELYLGRLGEGRPVRVHGEVMRHVDRRLTGDEACPDCVLAVRFEEPDGTTRLELDELVGIEPPPPAPAERRETERYEGRFLVTFHTEREFLHEYTENLSSRGLFLRTDEHVEVGTVIELELALPNYHDPIEIRARVVRRVTPDPQTGRAGGLGIEFIEPDRRAITFVEERVGAYRAAGL